MLILCNILPAIQKWFLLNFWYLQTELFDFCSKPNTFINECQAETYRDNDSYSKDLIQCIKVKYNSTDEKEYNEARKTLILRDPKYGDHKSQW